MILLYVLLLCSIKSTLIKYSFPDRWKVWIHVSTLDTKEKKKVLKLLKGDTFSLQRRLHFPFNICSLKTVSDGINGANGETCFFHVLLDIQWVDLIKHLKQIHQITRENVF